MKPNQDGWKHIKGSQLIFLLDMETHLISDDSSDEHTDTFVVHPDSESENNDSNESQASEASCDPESLEPESEPTGESLIEEDDSIDSDTAGSLADFIENDEDDTEGLVITASQPTTLHFSNQSGTTRQHAIDLTKDSDQGNQVVKRRRL